MDSFKRELQLIDLHHFKSLHAAVLVRLAGGISITQTAKDLGISRTTIYKLLKKPEFKIALLEEIRYQAAAGIIEDRCLKYRRAVLKAIIRIYSKVPNAIALRRRFEKYLDRIDARSGMDKTP